MRGYETPKVLLHDIDPAILFPEESAVLAEQGKYTPPHVSLPLLGSFKARSQEDQCRIIYICWETKSCLQPVIWAHRLIGALDNCGITWDWAHQKQYNGTQI